MDREGIGKKDREEVRGLKRHELAVWRSRTGLCSATPDERNRRRKGPETVGKRTMFTLVSPVMFLPPSFQRRLMHLMQATRVSRSWFAHGVSGGALERQGVLVFFFFFCSLLFPNQFLSSGLFFLCSSSSPLSLSPSSVAVFSTSSSRHGSELRVFGCYG